MDPRPPDLIDCLRPLGQYIARRLRYFEATGDVHPGELDVAELVDRTYLEAIRRLQQEPSQQPAYPWLRRLADRILGRQVRRLAAERNDDSGRAIVRSLPELIPDPDQPVAEPIAGGVELQRALARLLGELSDELREPFLLMMVDFYGPEEIGALEGISTASALHRVSQAADRMRRSLADLYGVATPMSIEQMSRVMEKIAPAAPFYLHEQPPA